MQFGVPTIMESYKGLQAMSERWASSHYRLEEFESLTEIPSAKDPDLLDRTIIFRKESGPVMIFFYKKPDLFIS